MKKFYYEIFILMFCFCISAGQNKSHKKIEMIKASRLNEQIIIDGKLDETDWNNQNYTDKLIQIEPVEGAEPTERTLINILYDNDYLYVGARLFDSEPGSIDRSVVRKDNATYSDKIFFFIVDKNDKLNGYYFSIDAGGSMQDGTISDDIVMHSSWDGVWIGKSSIDSLGWSCEIKIPFSQLRFENHENPIFFINLERYSIRKNEADYLAFAQHDQPGFARHFVELSGIENIAKKGNLEVIPYVTSKLTAKKYPDSDPVNKNLKNDYNLGGDIKYVFGRNLTLNMTVNPDFGQAEIDPAVINLSDVETNYAEKRPFFIEGSDIFDFGHLGVTNRSTFSWSDPYFYTRRIGGNPKGSLPGYDYRSMADGVHILEASKLSGSLGNNLKIGVIQSVTRREFAEIENDGQRSKVEIEPLTSYNIARVVKEFNSSQQSLGIFSMVTIRNFEDKRIEKDFNKNSMFTGIDGWSKLFDGEWAVSGWWGATYLSGNKERILNLQNSSVRYYNRPDAKNIHIDKNLTSLSGTGGRIILNKEKGNFLYFAYLGYITPGFEMNDLGYLDRSNKINTAFKFKHNISVPYGIIYRNYATLSIHKMWDFDHNNIASLFALSNYLTFTNYYGISVTWQHDFQHVSSVMTRGGPLMINPQGDDLYFSISSDYRRKTYVSATFDLTNFPDYYSNYHPSLSVDLRYWPSLRLTFSFDYQKYCNHDMWIGNFEDPHAVQTYNKRYVFGKINQETYSGSIRINWAFTPVMDLQVYIQPLISSAKYSKFKDLAQPGTHIFNEYDQNDTKLISGKYNIDPDANGPSNAVNFDNPDFTIRSFRMNMIYRWEYIPGSTVYLVWTQMRNDHENDFNFNFSHLADGMFEKNPDNIFMLKLTYWFQL